MSTRYLPTRFALLLLMTWFTWSMLSEREGCWGQGVQLPSAYGAPPSPYGAGGIPPSNGGAASFGPGIQPFDPYALPATSPSGGFGTFGANPYATPSSALPPAPAQTWPAPGIAPPPTYNAAPYGPPPAGQAPYAPYGVPPYSAAPYGAAPYGANPYGANPYAAPTGGQGYVPGMPATGSGPPFRRLFQDTGFRYTWLYGDGDSDSLQIHDVEISTTAYCPRCLFLQGPFRFTPGFAFHFLDGPSGPLEADLPGQLYSAYVDAGWAPEFTPVLSAEVSARAGVYTDFDTVTTQSLRFMGTGLGVIRVSPTCSLKLGAAYIDRNKIKVLPAGGILWQPNPQTRWDIFFPSPKLASYWTTVNNAQVWWYLGGEYGGGSWTFSRQDDPESGASEQFDYNDIRVFAGLEWVNLNRWYGFLEAGYVFDRELYFVVVPEESTSLANTFMLRAGLSF